MELYLDYKNSERNQERDDSSVNSCMDKRGVEFRVQLRVKGFGFGVSGLNILHHSES